MVVASSVVLVSYRLFVLTFLEQFVLQLLASLLSVKFFFILLTRSDFVILIVSAGALVSKFSILSLNIFEIPPLSQNLHSLDILDSC